jgi:NOL1/NOP2/fmu family ribosome biogenesis protein
MQPLKILNKKQVKQILAVIKNQWNAEIELDYAVLKNKDNKIYLINKQFAEIELSKLRINNIGLYFGQMLNSELRLSIEGSQIIGPNAKKNILEITPKQSRVWLRGEDLETDEKLNGFVLIKYKNDFFGTGKIKQGNVLNFVPKGRRLKISSSP